jgi:hypothetical protein
MGDITPPFTAGHISCYDHEDTVLKCRFLGSDRFSYLNIDSNSKRTDVMKPTAELNCPNTTLNKGMRYARPIGES